MSCEVAKGPGWELRLGDWKHALADVREVDALITDCPYSDRTHGGHNIVIDSGSANIDRLPYACFTADDVRGFVAHWAPLTRGWFVTLTDHVLGPIWEDSLLKAGRYVFSPIACVVPGSRPRLLGDGPAQWSTFAIVARPRNKRFVTWGSLPGAYVLPSGQDRDQPVIGGKPIWLMRSLARDYSRPGDLVCDPCSGSATTLLAAVLEGRKAIGAEMDPAHYAIGKKRLERGYTPSFQFDHPTTRPEQTSMFGEGDSE